MLAYVELENYLASQSDPSLITREGVQAIEKKYGLNRLADVLVLDMQNFLAMYIDYIIPQGIDALKGDEHVKVHRFF